MICEGFIMNYQDTPDINKIGSEVLSFDEEITIDYNTMPFDDTEGAEMRDIALSDLLYDSDFSIDDTLEYADILQRQGI